MLRKSSDTTGLGSSLMLGQVVAEVMPERVQKLATDSLLHGKTMRCFCRKNAAHLRFGKISAVVSQNLPH